MRKDAEEKKSESKPENYSLVNPSLPIDKYQWAVSLVRKPEGPRVNPEHGFLILEGVGDDNQQFVKRYDLFIYTYDPSDPERSDRSKEEAGYAFIKESDEKKASDSESLRPQYNKLIFREHADKERGLYNKSWNITKEQGEALHANIENNKLNPGLYNISGNENITGYSINTGSLKQGHNCFTWAREKLRELGDERINRDIQSEWTDKIVAITSRNLGPERDRRGCVIL